MKVETGEFTKDIEELSFDQIPLLDRDSATLLGNRKMGSMVDMVSQFEVMSSIHRSITRIVLYVFSAEIRKRHQMVYESVRWNTGVYQD